MNRCAWQTWRDYIARWRFGYFARGSARRSSCNCNTCTEISALGLALPLARALLVLRARDHIWQCTKRRPLPHAHLSSLCGCLSAVCLSVVIYLFRRELHSILSPLWECMRSVSLRTFFRLQWPIRLALLNRTGLVKESCCFRINRKVNIEGEKQTPSVAGKLTVMFVSTWLRHAS